MRKKTDQVIHGLVPYDDHKIKPNKSLSRPKEIKQYIVDRVEKLRELYEKHTPDVERRWVLPRGETDGRKAIVIESIIGEDISPFDLPDFEEQMPNIEDYAIEEETDELSRRVG